MYDAEKVYVAPHFATGNCCNSQPGAGYEQIVRYCNGNVHHERGLIHLFHVSTCIKFPHSFFCLTTMEMNLVKTFQVTESH